MQVDEPSRGLYLDIAAVSREVHLHHEAGDVPAAVDAVQLRAVRQVVEVHRALSGANSQVSRIWTEPVRWIGSVTTACLYWHVIFQAEYLSKHNM